MNDVYAHSDQSKKDIPQLAKHVTDFFAQNNKEKAVYAGYAERKARALEVISLEKLAEAREKKSPLSEAQKKAAAELDTAILKMPRYEQDNLTLLPTSLRQFQKKDLTLMASEVTSVFAFNSLYEIAKISEDKSSPANQKAAQKALVSLVCQDPKHPTAQEQDVIKQLVTDVKEVAAKTAGARKINLDIYFQMEKILKEPSKKQPPAPVQQAGFKIGAAEAHSEIKISDDQGIQTPQFDKAVLAAVKRAKSSNSVG